MDDDMAASLQSEVRNGRRCPVPRRLWFLWEILSALTGSARWVVPLAPAGTVASAGGGGRFAPSRLESARAS